MHANNQLSNSITVLSEFRFTRFWMRTYKDESEGGRFVYERYDYGKLERTKTFSTRMECDDFFAMGVERFVSVHVCNSRRKPFVRIRDVPHNLPKGVVKVFDPAKTKQRDLFQFYVDGAKKLDEQAAARERIAEKL